MIKGVIPKRRIERYTCCIFSTDL